MTRDAVDGLGTLLLLCSSTLHWIVLTSQKYLLLAGYGFAKFHLPFGWC